MDHFAYTIKVSVDPIVLSLMTSKPYSFIFRILLLLISYCCNFLLMLKYYNINLFINNNM